MNWEEFIAKSPMERTELFCPKLVQRANECLARFKRDFPNHRHNETALPRLLALAFQFHFYDGLVCPWARMPIHGNEHRTEWPQNRGEEFLVSIRCYGPLAFGWRTNRTSSSGAPGLMQIIQEHVDKLNPAVAFLCFTDLKDKTMAETVAELDKWGEKVSLAALKKMISRLW